MTHHSMQFRQIRDKIDYERVLDDLGLDWVEDKEELWTSCPLPGDNHRNGDTNPSFSVNVSDTDRRGLYSCFVCGGGNFVQLVSELKNVSYEEAFRWLDTQEISTDEDFVKRVERILSRSVVTEESSIIPILPAFAYHEWMDQFTPAAIEHFQIRYDPQRGGVILPHTFKGSLRGWQMRQFDKKPKYINTPGFPKKNTLFNYDEARNYGDVICVESPKSVIKLWGLGVKNAVATFGASVTDSQITTLTGFNEVSLWFDNDVAGMQATRSTLKRLRGMVNLFLIPPVEGESGDPGDLDTREQVDSYLKGRQSLLRYELGA